MPELQVRKIVERVDQTLTEYGKPVDPVHRVAIVAAVIKNPFPLEYVADVVTIADELAPQIGDLIGPRTVELLGMPVEAFGKAALVGIAGELEHGSALIHNLLFGNKFREPAGGTELLPAVEKVGITGDLMDIPLKHKLDSKTRSHHQTFTFRIEDSPRPDEIVIACAASNRGRPLSRLATFGSEVK